VEASGHTHGGVVGVGAGFVSFDAEAIGMKRLPTRRSASTM
jgi:hypothetical protein